jgi:hypothetical protein
MKTIFAVIKYLIIIALVGILLGALALYIAINKVFDQEPTLTEFNKASLEDIKRIKRIAIEVNSQFNQPGPKQLTVSERDINLGISHFGPTTIRIPDSTFARVNLAEQQSDVQLTLPANYVTTQLIQQTKQQLSDKQLLIANIAKGWVEKKWINATWSFNIDKTAEQGRWLSPGQLSIGSITLSEALSQEIADRILTEALAQPESKQMLDAWKNIKGVEKIGEQILIDYVLPKSGNTALTSYQSLVLTADEQQLVEIYVKHLKTLPKRGPLVALLAPLFETVKTRSSKSNDPAGENRAALLALAKAFGGDELTAMLSDTTARKIRTSFPPYTIYGRRDLAQHMVLSAGLTLVADEGIAELIGLDKEISDLRRGKTISAWDLLADKAGVRLANKATRSAKSARQLQIALADAKQDSDILPDLGADFSYSEDRFSTEHLDDLTALVELYLEELAILKK